MDLAHTELIEKTLKWLNLPSIVKISFLQNGAQNAY